MPLSLRDLVPEQTVLRVASGFRFTEGPLWHPDGYLLFSDIPASIIYKYVPGKHPEPFISPSRNSNGLTFDRQGRLLACEHGGRQVSRMDEGGQMAPLVTRYDGKRLNSPNDLVVHSSGSIFFTDPPYGIDPDPGELGFRGVYRWDPDGSLTLLTREMDRPNGLAFSPDEKTLYVCDSRPRHVLAYQVTQSLTLFGPRRLIDMNAPLAGNPDGMKADTEGNLYITGSGGVWVADPAGRCLGIITTPEIPANCAWGGADCRTLYITARTSLYSVRVNVPGAPAF